MPTLARLWLPSLAVATALVGAACLPDYVLVLGGDATSSTSGSGGSTSSASAGTATSTSTSAGSGGAASAVVTRLALGFAHTCALRDDGTVWCWGDNSNLQLGSGGVLQAQPVKIEGLGAASDLAAGAGYTCALLTSGDVACWGENSKAQLGKSASPPSAKPILVGLPGKAIAITASLGLAPYTCATLADSSVTCWGEADPSQRCGGPIGALPATNPALAGATALVLGYHDTCAVFADGHLACCGENDQGQLGNKTTGTTTQTLGPTSPPLTKVTHAAMGEYHICAVDHDAVSCWGDNVSGELCLGQGASQAIATPTAVPLLQGATMFSQGWRHGCALIDARVWCCGDAGSGQLGNAGTTASSTPVTAGLNGVTAIATGWTHNCAILADHSVWCWGTDDRGQLGDGASGMNLIRSSPVEVQW
jgi:alpha-tubulin suppressor-like RCC1 family protein